MTTVTFDTHQFIRRLRAAGFDEPQAEGLTEALAEAQGQADRATLRDLREVELTLKHEMELLRLELRDLERRMTIKLGTLMVVAIGLVATLVKLL